MPDYLAFYLAIDVKDGVVDGCKYYKNGYEFGPIGRDELYCGYQDHHVFIDAEQAVAGHEDLLVVLNRITST